MYKFCLNLYSKCIGHSITKSLSSLSHGPIPISKQNKMMLWHIKKSGTEISGRELNKNLDGVPLLKFTNDTDIHNGMKYLTGKNKDVVEFDPSGQCKQGGIYFTTLDYFMTHINSCGEFARSVHIEDDARVYVEHTKLKCNKIILGPKKPKTELLKELFNKCLENGRHDIIDEILRSRWPYVRYIDEKFLTNEYVIHLVQLQPRIIEFIDEKFLTYPMQVLINQIAIKSNSTTMQQLYTLNNKKYLDNEGKNNY